MILSKSKKLLATGASKCDNDCTLKICKAVTPNGSNWLFYCLKSMANPTYTLNPLLDLRPFMLWLIPQNKALAEYVERLLYKPRVRPQRPFMGKLLKICKGVFAMKTILSTVKNSSLLNLFNRLYSVIQSFLQFILILAFIAGIVGFLWLFLVLFLSLGA